ncbi:EamA family transporter [Halobaculum litoreum]|uniref:EamA family transporter n=1 Tax=Halobaculum litoreum TaxID=3031998 RepID=A0ABD5XXG4_9EURY
MLGATVAFSLGSLLLRRFAPGVSTAALQGWGMLGGALLLHLGSRGLGEPQAVVATPAGIATLAFLVVGPGVVAFLLYFHLLETVGATRTMLVGYLEPLAAAALSFALFGYLPRPGAALGFGLVLAGFALVEGRSVRLAAGGAIGRIRTALP